MNDKDKEAFDKSRKKFHGNMSPMNDDYGNRDSGFKKGWQAACDYKQKEIDELIGQLKSCVFVYEEKLDRLIAENAKLKQKLSTVWKEAEEFYLDD